MTRSDLEHLIRAAGTISDDTEIVVIGSQSVLGQFPDAPASLLRSAEADLFPAHRPERADLIDGSIGEGSPFHELYGLRAGSRRGDGDASRRLARELARHGMTHTEALVERLAKTELPASVRKIVSARIRGHANEGRKK
jgi:hypothetical protein